MSGPRGMYQYVSDDGTTYRLSMDASNAAAGSAVASDGTHPGVPIRHRPRYVLAQHPTTGVQKKIVICNVGTALWSESGGTLSLHDTFVFPSEAEVYVLKGRIGEKRYA